jgi:hypothetical protein
VLLTVLVVLSLGGYLISSAGAKPPERPTTQSSTTEAPKAPIDRGRSPVLACDEGATLDVGAEGALGGLVISAVARDVDGGPCRPTAAPVLSIAENGRALGAIHGNPSQGEFAWFGDLYVAYWDWRNWCGTRGTARELIVTAGPLAGQSATTEAGRCDEPASPSDLGAMHDDSVEPPPG